MDRRSFFQLVSIASGAILAGRAAATPRTPDGTGSGAEDSCGVLVDLTRCLGCRSCEIACAEANGLPEPAFLTEDVDPDSLQRKTSVTQWTVVNLHETTRGNVWSKRQCMHCANPACAAACLTKALVKTKQGPVVWRESKCMGCRYCMISCPFDGPKFEYHSPVPSIQKCRMCWERLQDGGQPACVENCAGEALTFGRRSALLEEGRRRIVQDPERYVSHIYGEHEVGGTSMLYLSPVPFEELGFPTNLGEKAYPDYTRAFLTAVPFVLILWPALLMGLRQATDPQARPAESHAAEPAPATGGEV